MGLLTHLSMHIFVDLLLALVILLFFKHKTMKNYLYIAAILLATNIIDLDHLLATPIYDPLRCSFNVHLFHKWWFMPFYILGLFFRATLIVSIGILSHVALDFLNCPLYF